MINHDNVTRGTSEVTELGSGPLEASRAQTKQTMAGIIIVFGILEQVRGVQRGYKRSFMVMSLWGYPENTVSGLSGSLEASRGL